MSSTPDPSPNDGTSRLLPTAQADDLMTGHIAAVDAAAEKDRRAELAQNSHTGVGQLPADPDEEQR